MTILVTGYKSKKELKENIGQRLIYMETSVRGAEYKATGSFTVAGRVGPLGLAKKEFFAYVTMADGLIQKVGYHSASSQEL